MYELLTINFPNGRGWQMPRYLARNLYEFIKQFEEAGHVADIYDCATEWLKSLLAEDRLKVIHEA